MEMHQVRYFLAVAQELNFSRAAEKCNVSQPSLSRAIQQLEGELGGPLFIVNAILRHLPTSVKWFDLTWKPSAIRGRQGKASVSRSQSTEESAPQTWNYEHNITGRDCRSYWGAQNAARWT